ncbi:hypothetical protein B0H19DRAFT_1252309 [Mycena capillaripes]|nr:hypothetical protein B0H19DRAFT_1252309 [Mycena capillaripes]
MGEEYSGRVPPPSHHCACVTLKPPLPPSSPSHPGIGRTDTSNYTPSPTTSLDNRPTPCQHSTNTPINDAVAYTYVLTPAPAPTPGPNVYTYTCTRTHLCKAGHAGQ